ncbi:histidine phosphatase family protein [Prochlorococcus marinus]|uniref:Histidine phosphatase family protein n=1 Tax=Prochlorococcus marinus XMU1408 TaxID=2213228 RepID=A0A318R3A8_PROMR|nr:histidine phosphatase family protein [Prochlorococcus marinus]MBW3041542.1 histidine phosphatase family protein [Prochlorococcus marinus str. XMU1408]PYE02700.1 histidine phosphatase family protein [Prochlorococcus marinus XMU1408]
MTLRLIFVRHGLSSFNKEGRIQGRNDLSTLTKEGQSQAEAAGKIISSIPIDAVYSSPLQRASETTKIIIKQHQSKLQATYTNDLLEVDLGPWSGLTKNELKNLHPDKFAIWEKEPKELTINREDGSKFQPIKELLTQAENFLKSIFKSFCDSNKTILIVAHNAILRCLILKLINEPSKGFRRIKLDNTSISICNIDFNNWEDRQVQIQCLNNIAHLKPSLPKNNSKKRIILVRHGETNWNKQGRFQGQIDIPLNQNGKEQANAAREFMKHISIQKAFSSPLSRPRETAEIILKEHPGIEISLKDNLKEIGHGKWEGKLESEIKSDWPDLLETWKISPEEVQMPEGENINQVSTRSITGWVEICKDLKDNETALVVAHDAVNKTILCHLLGLTPSEIWMIKQGNGGITVIDISEKEGQPDQIACLNVTSHLGGIIDTTAIGAL